MKKEYDFSKGERGKFYREEMELNIPIYLEPENERFLRQIAEKNKTSLSAIVNQLLTKDRELITLGA